MSFSDFYRVWWWEHWTLMWREIGRSVYEHAALAGAR